MLDFFGNFSKEAAAVIAGLLGAALGGLVKAGWDRWISDRTVPTQALLDRLANNQQGLSSRGRRRLQEEADAALNEWRRRLIPPTSKRKLRSWPSNREAIFARGLTTPDGDSYCPVSSGENGPMFLRLEASDNTSNRYDSLASTKIAGQQLEALTVHELRARFTRLADEVKLSAELIKVINFNKGNEPSLWVVAPEVTVHTSEDATRLLQKLAEEVRAWIPGARVVLEIYLPEVIQDQIRTRNKGLLVAPDEAMANDMSLSPTSTAARYAAARNEAHKAFSSGITLGDLQKPYKYSIPKAILDERLEKHVVDILSDETWTALTVSGGPGSGKTESAGLLLKIIEQTCSAVVLVFATPELLIDLEKLHQGQNREEVFFNLARAFCFRERLSPTRFQRNDESRNAFMEALFQLLKDENRHQSVVFVVDDLHARREIREVLTSLREHADEWKLRFVLIGRTEIERYDRESLIAVRCELWNREQAQRILADWAEKERHRDIEIALNEGWLAEQKRFSIYLIRLIAENVDDLSSQRTNASSLLRHAIDKHLSSVTLEISTRSAPSDELLLKVENMLTTGVLPEKILAEIKRETAIDLVQLLGILSWVSHFEAQDTILTANKIKQWSQGLLLTDQDAKKLIEAGEKANIFRGFKGAAVWYDKLVADGCAALYLGLKVEDSDLDDSLIAEMIESLNRSDSIDILTLALDTPVLLRIIEAVANTRPSLATAINKLVTTEFILQLKRNPEWLVELWDHLWRRGSRASGQDVTPFAMVLGRLLPLDKILAAKCRDAISKGNNDEAVLALAVKATQVNDVEQFIQEVEPYAPTYLSLVVADAAVRFCVVSDVGGLSSYLAKLVEVGFSEKDIGRLWKVWCARQKTELILEAVDAFIKETKEETTYENIYRLFADIGCREIASRAPSEREKHLHQLQHWKIEIRELAQKGKKLASPLAKWVAYFQNPEIVEKDSAWVVIAGKDYALPKRPNKPLYVSQIFANIRQCYPHFELAASGEIRHVERSNEGHDELVRDKLPPGFSYTEDEIKRILPVNLRILSEQSSESFVTKEKLNSLKLVWRPRLNLMS